jgi:hypothetical protein
MCVDEEGKKQLVQPSFFVYTRMPPKRKRRTQRRREDKEEEGNAAKRSKPTRVPRSPWEGLVRNSTPLPHELVSLCEDYLLPSALTQQLSRQLDTKNRLASLYTNKWWTSQQWFNAPNTPWTIWRNFATEAHPSSIQVYLDAEGPNELSFVVPCSDPNMAVSWMFHTWLPQHVRCLGPGHDQGRNKQLLDELYVDRCNFQINHIRISVTGRVISDVCLAQIFEPHTGEHTLLIGSVADFREECKQRPLYTLDGDLWLPHGGCVELVRMPPVTRTIRVHDVEHVIQHTDRESDVMARFGMQHGHCHCWIPIGFVLPESVEDLSTLSLKADVTQ